MTRDGRKDIRRSVFTRCRRGGQFSVAMHETAVSDGRENRWKRQIKAEDARSQINLRDIHGMSWTESNLPENLAIPSQCKFVVRPTIEIVEYNAWQALARKATKVFDIHRFPC